MHTAAVMLLGLSAGLAQPPAADNYPIADRKLKLPIEADPAKSKDVQEYRVYASADKGQSWQLAAKGLPGQRELFYEAPADGEYWLNLATVFKTGVQSPNPADVTFAQTALRVLLDATPPQVRITAARRDGDEVVVEWEVKEAYPDDAVTQVAYQMTAADPGSWTAVPLTAAGRSVRFRPTLIGPLVVKVTAKDLARNAGSATKEVAATTAVTAVEPPVQTVLGADKTAAIAPPPVMPNPGGAGGIVVPTMVAAPKEPPPAQPVAVAQPPATQPEPLPKVSPAPAAPVAVQTTPPAPAAPTSTWTATDPAAGGATPAPAPIAVGGGAPAAAADPSVQVVNFLRFDLQYQLDTGPSGVKAIDLYVTRDGGRSWLKWSQHDGRETPLKVALDTRFNPQVEGDYGFRLVPVSGAGLSDGPPPAGSPPEMRVRVDVTRPTLEAYQPTADPNQRNALVLHWRATDDNFGRDPIGIDWSEQPTGPWKPVAGGGLVQVAGGAAARLPNTGSFTWQLPAGLNTHQVYLRFTATDAAGNQEVAVTQQPVLVDLTKPRARIQGIQMLPGGRP